MGIKVYTLSIIIRTFGIVLAMVFGMISTTLDSNNILDSIMGVIVLFCIFISIIVIPDKLNIMEKS